MTIGQGSTKGNGWRRQGVCKVRKVLQGDKRYILQGDKRTSRRPSLLPPFLQLSAAPPATAPYPWENFPASECAVVSPSTLQFAKVPVSTYVLQWEEGEGVWVLCQQANLVLMV